jgi:hypothetical protein
MVNVISEQNTRLYTYIYIYIYIYIYKGKAIPVTGLGGPYGFDASRLSHFLDNRLTNGARLITVYI